MEAKATGHEVAVACGGTGEAGASTGKLVQKLQAENIPVIKIKNFQRNMSFLSDIFAFFEVLLAVYRDDPSPQARESLKFLERELQQVLEDEYESQISVQTGVANTDEEERELVEPGRAITDESEQDLQGTVKIVLDSTMNWDLEDTEARQTQSRGRRDEYDADARKMQEADAQRTKQQMLEFKARSLFLSFLV